MRPGEAARRRVTSINYPCANDPRKQVKVARHESSSKPRCSRGIFLPNTSGTTHRLFQLPLNLLQQLRTPLVLLLSELLNMHLVKTVRKSEISCAGPRHSQRRVL